MGCFNTLCAISGLQIKANDQIVVIPLFDKCEQVDGIKAWIGDVDEIIATNNSMYRNPSRYLGIPFRACYDEYGSFDLETESQYGYTWLISHIVKSNVKICFGENRINQRGFDPSWLNSENKLEALKTGVHDKTIFVDYTKNWRSGFGSPCIYGLSFAFVKAEIYDYIVNEKSDYNNFMTATISAHLADVCTAAIEFQKASQITDFEKMKDAKSEIIHTFNDLEFSRFAPNFYPVHSEKPSAYISGRSSSLDPYIELLKNLQIVTSLSRYVEMQGKTWVPATSSGQFGDDSELIKFNDYVKSIAYFRRNEE